MTLKQNLIPKKRDTIPKNKKGNVAENKRNLK